ncbi:helix-turn-helix domain-containing protein [Dechloromonas sp. ZS-1]|uniref:helix-turn-helix domain-containing protein n=1 Tax=Dechloromonas sp. ZS-1 TaxID=3138067 RepID=UPI0031FD5249
MSEQYTEVLVEQPISPAEAGPSVGARLRAAREARSLSLHDIANTLKLGARQVEALEDGNWEALPGHTFIRGFVRNYARLVELDAAELMASLDRTLVKPKTSLDVVESGAAVLPTTGRGLSRRDRNVVLSGLVAVALAAVVYIALPDDLSAWREGLQGALDSLSRKEEPVPAAETTAQDPVLPPGTTPQQVLNPQAEMVAPPALEAAPLRFVFDKESWIEVRDRSNKVIFSQRNGMGSEQQVAGEGPFSLVIGYAPGVRLFWRGQPIDLAPHTRGDVARLVLE